MNISRRQIVQLLGAGLVASQAPLVNALGTASNPLSDDKPLKFSPFVGVSLDLEIKELFGGINRLVK